VHPRGRQPEIIEKLSPFRSRERSLQMGTPFGRHVIAAKFAKRLNEKTA
jgi:hypothetical protein